MYRKVNREDVFALPLLVLVILHHASEEEFLCMPKSAKTRAHSVPLRSEGIILLEPSCLLGAPSYSNCSA